MAIKKYLTESEKRYYLRLKTIVPLDDEAMDKIEAMDQMTKQFKELSVNQIVARRCYTMSKMTVIDEANYFEKHIRMTFVEYLELLCRIAYYHFDDVPDKKDLPYIKKLEIVVD